MNDLKKKALSASRILNGIGGLLLGLVFFFPEFSTFFLFLLILIIPICLLVIHLFKGELKFDDPKNPQHPSLTFVMVMVPIGLLLKTILTYLIIDFLNAILIAIPITILITYLTLKGTKEFSSKTVRDYVNYLFVAIFLFGYSFGSVVIISCEFDSSISEETKHVKVIQKDEGNLIIESYQVKVETQDEDSVSTTLPITPDLFKAIEINDSIAIDFKDGLLEIPWIKLRMIND